MELNARSAAIFSLIAYTACYPLMMEWVCAHINRKYSISIVVLLSEALKFIICLSIYVLQKAARSDKHVKHSMATRRQHNTVIANLFLASFIYTVQNNLNHFSYRNLDPITYQTTSQLKLISTAIFFSTLTNSIITKTTWISLFILTVGVILTQPFRENPNQEGNYILGLVSIVVYCTLSGLAGVITEKTLKSEYVPSTWLKNTILTGFGTILSLFYVLVIENLSLKEDLDSCANIYVISLIVFNATGGILIGLVMKHSNNIIKGYAVSISIVINVLMNVVFYNRIPHPMRVLGCLLIVLSSLFKSK